MTHIFLDPARLSLQVEPIGFTIAELCVYKWRCGYACPNIIHKEYDVDMDDEYKIAHGQDKIWTTGVATCVATVIRCYDKDDKYIASYLRHDSMFADEPTSYKCDVLLMYLEEVLTHVPTSVKLHLYFVGGCKRPIGNYKSLRQKEEKDIHKLLKKFEKTKQITCELKAYLLFFNRSSHIDGEDCSSVSVIACHDGVHVIMNDDIPNKC